MKRLFLASVFVFIALAIQANAVDSLFVKANEAYNKEYFEDAVAQYQKIIEQGYESADLYYNLGNAYFKLKDYPSAILYFEKAKKLNPSDEDIAFNLQVANLKIVDKIEPVPELFFKVWWRNFYNLFPADSWAIIGVSSFILFFILLAFYLLSKIIRIRKLAFFAGVFMLFITIFTLSLAHQKHQLIINQNQAIVFVPTLTVKSSPNPNSVDLFVIHEGAKVDIRDEVSGWVEIKIANGSVGWLPADALKKI